MIEKILTDEQRDEMAAKIWEETQVKIKESISYAIQHELRADMSSRIRKLTNAEIDKLVRPAVEARMDELQKTVEIAVGRMFDRLEEAAWEELDQKLRYRAEGFFGDVVRAVVGDLASVTKNVMEARLREFREARARRFAEKQAVKKEDAK